MIYIISVGRLLCECYLPWTQYCGMYISWIINFTSIKYIMWNIFCFYMKKLLIVTGFLSSSSIYSIYWMCFEPTPGFQCFFHNHLTKDLLHKPSSYVLSLYVWKTKITFPFRYLINKLISPFHIFMYSCDLRPYMYTRWQWKD